MDFYKVPIGFGMALAMNPPALNAYSAMTEEQKQQILNKAHNARSEKEMHDIVNSMSAISHYKLCHRFFVKSVAIFIKEGFYSNFFRKVTLPALH